MCTYDSFYTQVSLTLPSRLIVAVAKATSAPEIAGVSKRAGTKAQVNEGFLRAIPNP